MSSSNLARQIAEVAKSKISLTEAIHELELSKEAFSTISSLSAQIQQHNSSIQEVKSRLEYFVSSTYFNSKLEELAHTLDKAVKSRVDELSVSVLSQLNNKVTIEDAECLFSKRVPWSNFTVLSQEVGMMKARMEKHILSDFEGLKTKIKLDMNNSSKAKRPQDQVANEEFNQMKLKIADIEEQLQVLFNEDNIDEDYDSKEELDNMMDDLERAVLKDKRTQELVEGEEIEIEKTENLNQEELKPEDCQQELKSPDKIDDQDTNKLALDMEINKNNQIVNTNSPKNIASSRGESRSYMRKNSKASSMNSRAMAGASAAIRNLNKKFDTLKKEIDDNKLEFLVFKEDTRRFDEEIGELRENFNIFEQKFKDFDGQIEVMQSSFLRALRRSGVTKEKSIKAEKNSKDNKKGKVNSKEFENLCKDMEEKFKRVVKVETNFQHVASEFNIVKSFFKDKLKEISDGHLNILETVVGIKKDIESLKKKETIVEKWVNDKIDKISAQICEVKGPLTNIVSDQLRESSSLQEEVRRNQEIFRNLIEDYNIRPMSQVSNRKSENSEKKVHSRVNSATPTLSIKHRFYKSNNKNDVTSIEENWLGNMPEGKVIWLPRMSYSANKPERQIKTPDIDKIKH